MNRVVGDEPHPCEYRISYLKSTDHKRSRPFFKNFLRSWSIHQHIKFPETFSRIANTGRPGPVVLIPRGIADREINDVELFAEPAYSIFPSTRIPPDREQIRQAVALLAAGSRSGSMISCWS